MKVLFDHQIFMQRYGGISKYHYGLIKELYRKRSCEISLSLVFSDNFYINSDSNIPAIDLKKYLGDKIFKGKHTVFKMINRLVTEFNLRNGDYDLFHPTFYDPYWLTKTKKPTVITIHDFNHERFSYNLKDSLNKKKMIYSADAIIAISNNTKEDILEFYPDISEDKIHVVYHGFDGKNTQKTPLEVTFPFILFVGRRDGYKNFEKFVGAIHNLIKEKKIHLVCTGIGFSHSEIQMFNNLDISNSVHCFQASETELNYLYSEAICFVFPSLYEGFGLPILEAFSNGCPVILNNSSSLPEIAGDAAIYFDGNNSDSICGAITTVMQDNELRSSMIRLGNERLQLFSMEEMADRTVAVYKSLL